MRIALFSIFFVFASLVIRAQTDTLSLSVEEAGKILLQKNLLLLASKYNVDASAALIRQAKLLDNPLLLTDQTLYDGKFFPPLSGVFKEIKNSSMLSGVCNSRSSPKGL